MDRRNFLGTTLAWAASWQVGLGNAAMPAGGPVSLSTQLHAFIRMAQDGSVTLTLPKVEMGQGIHTAFAQLLAEELDLSMAQVRVADAPADDKLFGDPIFGGLQMTGGSTSIRGSYLSLRRAGAGVRLLLVNEAARRWQVPATTLRVVDGQVTDTPGARRLAYADLAAAVAGQPLPSAPPLKAPDTFRLIGRQIRRIEGPHKVDGSARFGIDARLPGMKVGAVAACPVFGGSLARTNDAAALAVPGVRGILRLPAVVAVVADDFWTARQGLAALAPEWNDGPNAKLDTEAIRRQLEEGSGAAGALAAQQGDATAALATAPRKVRAVYEAPFLAHATMEPINCTVHVRPDSVDLWLGTQVPTRARDVAARVAGVSPDRVSVHNHLLGGGFGRRLEVDFVEVAVGLARQVDMPLKLVWSREEDIQHDMYRPYYRDQLEAGLDAKGKPVAWTHRVAGSSIIARFFPPNFKNGLDADAVDGARELPYALPALRVDYVRVEPPGVPTAFWRGVGPTHNGFVVEGFIDELAHAAQADPLAYRLSLVNDARARRVLELAAEKAGWGSPLAGPRQGRGIALLHAFGSYVAQVMHVAVDDQGTVSVLKVDCAIDCGVVVNPGTVVAQMEGGIVFGLSAALWGRITIANGRVEQSNFHDVRLMRMSEMPRIAVHLVPSTEAPGGVGEPGTAAAIPALVNALHAATGKRIRRLPVDAALAAS